MRQQVTFQEFKERSPIKDGDIAMEFYLKKNKIKLSVEYLYIIRYKNRVIVFVRSFPKPTARLQQKKKGKQVVLHFDPSLCVPYLDYKERKCKGLRKGTVLGLYGLGL